MKKFAIFLTVLVICFATSVFAIKPIKFDADTCRVSYQGYTYDFSSLVNQQGGYVINAPWQNVSYVWHIQVCNALKPIKSCESNYPGSAAIRINGTECSSLGDATMSAFYPNPGNDGMYLTYYNGDPADNVIHQSARIYFICDQKKTVPIVFEHETQSCYQFHFRIMTPLACKSHAIKGDLL